MTQSLLWWTTTGLAAAIALCATAPVCSADKALLVSDFEQGLSGWRASDEGKYGGKTSETKLIAIAVSDAAHSGRHSLEVNFNPGDGWANAWVDLSRSCSLWADAHIDEITLWMKGDGSRKEVKVGLQAWADDLVTPVFYTLPVSLGCTVWRQIAVPLSRLQASSPSHPLRLLSLISLQIDGSGATGPARLWIDDIEVRNAHGEGGRFATGPLDEQIAVHGPTRELPRLGNWGWPGGDGEALKKCLELGIGFYTNGESALQEQRNFLAGIATNYFPGRPSGSELIAGLGLTDEDMDQDSQGRRTGEGVESAVFHPSVPGRFCDFIRKQIRPLRNAPWVASFMLSSPISLYGEVHYPASSGGQYAVFGRQAKENFRRWLRSRYDGDLSALSHQWGQPFKSWDEVAPPDGPQAGPGGIDTRKSWSDFIHWYNWWLDEVTWRSLQAARSETSKPIAAMIGGPKAGFSQGIALGNVGPVVRMLGKVRPAFFNDTDAQSLFSTRYTRAACSQYGVELMLENVGPPYLEVFHQYNMLLNILSCGADHIHLAHSGQLFDPKHWFSRTWKNLAPLALRYRTGYVKSDAAIFHSYVTSWYRSDRSNPDAVRLYDSTNTLWTPDKGYPSWGRALGSPDVVDDAMIEDGALKGRKLLVIPNNSVTVTTRKAVEAIRRWVKNGGTVVGFGVGCLAYTVEKDCAVTPTPGMAGMVQSSNADEIKADAGASRIERKIGKGRALLYLTAADPALKGASGKLFVEEMMPALVAEADRAGVRRWCRADEQHQVNLIYCGKDLNSGRHLFTADFTHSARSGLPDAVFYTDRTFQLTFDRSLVGDAELVGITDSFESCEGGSADFNPDAHTLIVRFSMPGKLILKFGKGRGRLGQARGPAPTSPFRSATA